MTQGFCRMEMNMIINLSEEKQQKDMVEEKLMQLKKEYLKPRMSERQLVKLQKKMEKAKQDERRERVQKKMIRFSAIAAALIATFVILPNTSATVAHAMGQIPIIGQLVNVVTLRNYEYDTERNMASVEVPEIVIENSAAGTETQDKLQQTTEEINEEIRKITDEMIAHFEKYLEDEQGYQDIMVKSEVLATTPDYFTLKLFCYQGAGSGYQWNYYYTIDLSTGERLQLKDIFIEGADYITPISENIKAQMEEQMAADEMVYYWLHDEIEELNFNAITEEASFYLNENGNVVIGFDEGDVAPMYMGAVEFEIPAEVLSGIRR